MLLDLRNNELIFSKILDKKDFRKDLQAMKGVKAREYKDKFYISLAHFEVVRQVLSGKFKGQISFSNAYSKFANSFVLPKGPVIIEWEPSTCTVRGPNLPWNDIIPTTSYFDKRAMNAKTYGKSWSGYTHLFDTIRGMFPSGLLEMVVRSLEKNNVPYEVNRKFSYPAPYLDLKAKFSFTPTEDQIAAVDALSKANNGIGKLPTGFGKTSYVAAALIAKKGVRSLFLANQRVLTDDAKSDFEEVFKDNDIKIGMIGDGEFDPGDITVASIQSIASALKPPSVKEKLLEQHQLELAEERLKYLVDVDDRRQAERDILKHRRRLKSIGKRMERHEQIIPFLKSVDLFIVDEAQVLGTNQWDTFLHMCPAPYRYTLSATDTRTDGGRIQIVAATGERRFESSAGDQIEKGRLSEFIGHFTKFDHKLDRDVMKEMKLEYNQAYEVFIVHNDKRNRHLCYKVIEWARDYSVLALVTRIAHGEIVKDFLVSMGMGEDQVKFIDGETPKNERKQAIEDFRNSKFPVLIGTSIFDVGFNAKNAAKMVRFNAGGSEVREPQRAGRTIRLREDGSIGETYDLIDVNVPFFEAQGWKRYRFLRNEFGYERTRIHNKVIEGDMNIVGLKELVAAIPDETDRKKGEEIIQTLVMGEQNQDELPNYDLNDLEPKLKNILDELIIPDDN
jgi:superfamily II DNA or RNA helicase